MLELTNSKVAEMKTTTFTKIADIINTNAKSVITTIDNLSN
jgi:hypothetical protein